MPRRFESRRTAAPRGAFTLIEVLVVVAIIALLIAILLPSLQRARIQAQNVACAANAKAISLNVGYYQTEFNGFVPVMFNFYANGTPHHRAPARACWLSIALRRYEQGLVNLAQRESLEQPAVFFNPEQVWNNNIRQEYMNRFLPDHYTCPFEREGEGERLPVEDAGRFHYHEWRGRFDSYHTWLWEDIVRGDPSVHGMSSNWGGPTDGIPEYTVFSWNRVSAWPSGDPRLIPGSTPAGTSEDDSSKHAYRRWDNSCVHRMRSGTLGDITVLFCAQGEHVLLNHPGRPIPRANRGSHPTPRGGGTNAVFADLSVRWVKGTRIGWP